MAGDFNIGRDARLGILLPNGSALDLGQLTDFGSKQETIDLKSRPLNGRVIHQIIPDGWTFTAGFDRANGALDDYFAQSEEDFYAGRIPGDIFITQTVKDSKTGALRTYRYFGVVMKFDDAGTYKQDEKVAQKVAGMASGRQKVL